MLALATCVVFALVLEAVFRIVGFDFEFKAHAFNTVPIFYRQPIVPVGPAFFRRPGPDRWEGNVLDVMYRMGGGKDGAYRDAERAVVTYDELGFRNPEDLRDWEIVVTGDSFTELGFLPWEELFTTRLGEELGVRVKNLGVSYTGTFTQTYFVEQYGKAPAAKEAMLVFFEGNDFIDIVDEHQRLEAARASGAPPKAPLQLPTRLENLPKQSSFLVALYRFVTGRRPVEPVGSHPFVKNAGEFNAYFLSEGGRQPLTVEFMMPPAAADLPALERSVAKEAIAGWAITARALGLRPWLVFMPCKRRALDGHIVWKGPGFPPPVPKGIPEFIGDLAQSEGVRFVDLTPDLHRETDAGRLTYNGIWDTHLNRLGAHTVGHRLATVLREAGGGS
jgi:hypothetical protein